MARKKKEQVEKSILESARRLFARFGLKKTTMDDIAQQAGVGKATIYYYFRDKEEVFLKVIQKEADELLVRLEQAIAEYENPELKLKAMILERAVALAELVNLRWLNTAGDALRYQELAKERRRLSQREQKLLEQILREGKEQGLFSLEDPNFTARSLSELISALERNFESLSPQEVKSRLEASLRLILDGIRARKLAPQS